MKKFLIIFCICSITVPLFSSEKGLIGLAEFHYGNKEYYNAVTETLRYQHLYPRGNLYPQSMLIMGKSYFKGGDREKALKVFLNCYNRYTDEEEGERALFYSGLVRLDAGSYSYAARTFQEYNYIYNTGIFREEVIINLSIIQAYAENYNEAEKNLAEYKKIFPGGKLREKADRLSVAIKEAEARPKKSLLVAGLSSAVIPGSGYFYTGKYMLGVFSLLSNGALIYGIYDGYKRKSPFQMIFFSVIELSFYNYSLIGSIRSADEYNQGMEFKKEYFLGLKTEF